MNFADQMNRAWTSHDSMLCVGLDPDPDKLPVHLRGRPRSIFEFCTAIVDATADLVCAFKPQIAYFGSARAEDQLEELIAYIHERWPQVPVILDAKRGDIGSTAEHYARESFERYKADAVTLSPYMGRDSIEPYLAYDGRGLVLLCRTSNPGGSDLQMQALSDGSLLYEHVARLASGAWGAPGRIGLVVGATYPAQLARVRSLAPDLPLLVPGIGAQGGDLEASVAAGLASGGYGMIVSSSRAILYASQGEDFAQAARQVAKVTLDAMRLAATRTRTRA